MLLPDLNMSETVSSAWNMEIQVVQDYELSVHIRPLTGFPNILFFFLK